MKKIFCLIIFIINFCLTDCQIVNKSDIEINADRYYQNNKYVDAKNLYMTLHENDSLNKLYVYRLGYCYKELEEYDKSNNFFLKSVTNNYRIIDSYINLSTIAVKQSKFIEARNYLSIADSISPMNSKVLQAISDLDALIKILNYENL